MTTAPINASAESIPSESTNHLPLPATSPGEKKSGKVEFLDYPLPLLTFNSIPMLMGAAQKIPASELA